MPSIDVVRFRILNIVRSTPGFIRRRVLERKIGPNYRSQSDEQISQMLSEGILVQIGTGVRGDPFAVGLNTNFPPHICPCCVRPIPQEDLCHLP